MSGENSRGGAVHRAAMTASVASKLQFWNWSAQWQAAIPDENLGDARGWSVR
jgi:hypothetical protein